VEQARTREKHLSVQAKKYIKRQLSYGSRRKSVFADFRSSSVDLSVVSNHNIHFSTIKAFISLIALGAVLTSYSTFAHIGDGAKSKAAGEADPPFG
jgi:hypothetical protein